MARFRFKLEPVLRVRKSREEEALRSLGAAQRAYQAELSRKAELLSQLEQALIRREGLGARAISIDAFRLEQDFIIGAKQRVVQCDQAIFRASKLVERALRAYLVARKQTRMIETLREKAYAEFRREQAKRERKEQDELVIMRHRLREEDSILKAAADEGGRSMEGSA